MISLSRPRFRYQLSVILAVAGVTMLAGCTSNPVADSVTTAESRCDTILGPTQVSRYGDGGLVRDYTPTAAPITKVVALGGTACAWQGENGRILEVAVAHVDTAAATDAGETAALRLQAVPTYGTPPKVEGYFGMVDGVGEAQLFAKSYWLVLRSGNFVEPGDVQQLAATALGNLPD